MTNINLPVPFFTQRDNTYVWQQISTENEKDEAGNFIKKMGDTFGPKYPMAWRSCNITSLCMILHYFGITGDSPDDMLLEKELTIDGDEVETEIECNFDVERVVDEEELELEIIGRLQCGGNHLPSEQPPLLIKFGGRTT